MPRPECTGYVPVSVFTKLFCFSVYIITKSCPYLLLRLVNLL